MSADSEIVIAIVDDEESVRAALSRLVRSAGFSAVTFASGADFIAWAPRGKPHCVVLDLHMPHLDGFEVHRQLLQQRLKLPIIIITGHDTPENCARVIGQGAYAHLRKPVDDVLLLSAISAALATPAPAAAPSACC